MTRKFFVWLHRWFGLAMAVFLVIEGITGSMLAFNPQLTRLFNPRLFVIRPSRAPCRWIPPRWRVAFRKSRQRHAWRILPGWREDQVVLAPRLRKIRRPANRTR